MCGRSETQSRGLCRGHRRMGSGARLLAACVKSWRWTCPCMSIPFRTASKRNSHHGLSVSTSSTRKLASGTNPSRPKTSPIAQWSSKGLWRELRVFSRFTYICTCITQMEAGIVMPRNRWQMASVRCPWRMRLSPSETACCRRNALIRPRRAEHVQTPANALQASSHGSARMESRII